MTLNVALGFGVVTVECARLPTSEERFSAGKAYILRSRSNNHVGRDLLAIRAFGEAQAVIQSKWCSNERSSERVWAVYVVVGPCLMNDNTTLVNLCGLLKSLADLDCSLVCSGLIDGTACLRICCGDVPQYTVLCNCKQHVHSVFVMQSSDVALDDAIIDRARQSLKNEFDAAALGGYTIE